MVSPLYLRRNRKIALKVFLKDLGSRFESSPFNKIQYTIKPNQLKKDTKISQTKTGNVIKSFLDSKGKYYETQKSYLGARYIIEVSREELENWKEDFLSR